MKMNLLTLSLFTISITTSSAVELNKCCSKSERFNVDLECITNDKDEHNNDFSWIPKDILKNLNISLKNETILNTNLTIVFDKIPNCSENSQEYLVHHVHNEIIEFDFHMENNEIFLEVLKQGSVYGSNRRFSSGSYCVDTAGDDVFAVLVCPCDTMVCVRKCCGEGEVYNETESACEEAVPISDGITVPDWEPDAESDDEAMSYYLLASKQPECADHEFHSFHTIQHGEPRANGKSRFLLQKDGSIQVIDEDMHFPVNEYCGDRTVDDDEMVYFCIKSDQHTETITTLYGVLLLVSAVALFITVAVMIAFKELRRNNVNKMSLMHNVMLLIGFSTTGVVQLSGHTLSSTTCIITSFLIQFSMLAAFFWLNAMCIDIAWLFSGLLRADSDQYSRKRFLCYSVYAWGCSTLITLITAVVEFATANTTFKPNFGIAMCFFNSHAATILFFYGPMAVILLTNFLLTIYTAVQILRRARIEDEGQIAKNKQKLFLFVKLFTLMGGTWVFDVVSWAVGGDGVYWIFTDIINLLRGVFIFVIFCCNRHVYNLVRDKITTAVCKKDLLSESKYSSVSRIELDNIASVATNKSS